MDYFVYLYNNFEKKYLLYIANESKEKKKKKKSHDIKIDTKL